VDRSPGDAPAGAGTDSLNILLIGLNTAPEEVGVGRYTGELTAWLAAYGHRVRVVAAPPYYPAWRVAAGYRADRFRWDRAGGAEVLRVPLYVPTRAGGVRHVLHHLSFGCASLLGAHRAAHGLRPDVVVCVVPSLAALPAALLAARRARAPAWLHVQDLQVDIAFALGLLRGRPLHRLARRLEGALVRRFQRVSAISDSMLHGLAARGVPEERLSLLPNWVDCDAIRPEAAPADRAAFGLAPDKVVALYSGSLGRRQEIAVIAEAARQLADRADIQIAVFGAGPGLRTLQAAAGDIDNLVLGDLVPLECLGRLLAAADVHLLPQMPAVAPFLLPSKVGGMLASGRPVIAAAPAGSDLDRLVEGAGVLVAENSAAAFAAALRALADAPDRRARLGAAGRARVCPAMDRTRVLQDFERALRRLAGS
jgi:colanic acid biosynthesis glycosyl transferase WcaI